MNMTTWLILTIMMAVAFVIILVILIRLELKTFSKGEYDLNRLADYDLSFLLFFLEMILAFLVAVSICWGYENFIK